MLKDNRDNKDEIERVREKNLPAVELYMIAATA